jgi:hypothetical protein
MKRAYAKLGGQLGLVCVGLGLLLIGLAWNGAAGIDFVSGQIPYLLSGGFLGLSLVVLGVALAVIESGRKNRAMLEAELRELNTAVSRLASALASGAGNGHAAAATTAPAERVLLGQSSYHRVDCKLAEGKDLPASTPDAAAAEGLTPCRICNPSSSVLVTESRL